MQQAKGYTRKEAALLLGVSEREFGRKVEDGKYPEPEEDGTYDRNKIEELRDAKYKKTGDPVIDGFAALLKEQTHALRESRAHIERQNQVLIAQHEKTGAVIDKLVSRIDTAETQALAFQKLMGEELLAKEERKDMAYQRELRGRALLQAANALEKNLPNIIAQFGGGQKLKSFMSGLSQDDKFGLFCLQNSFTGAQRERFAGFLKDFGITLESLTPEERAQYEELSKAANEPETKTSGPAD
jgi:hypothetical protein